MIAAGQPMTPAAVVDVMARYATVPAADYASPAAATRAVTADGIGTIPVSYTDRGAGPVFLLLHGGAGPQSVTGFADLLADTGPARVIVPVHPGFGGTPRPDGLSTIAGLARLYAALLDELELDGVTVIGNSVGGWIAAEMAVAGSARIAGLVLVDAVGIEVPGHPVADFFLLTLDQVAELSYHHPAAFRINPAAMSEEQRRVMAGNREALAVYAGTDMAQKGLNARLPQIKVPTLRALGSQRPDRRPGVWSGLRDRHPRRRVPDAAGHRACAATRDPGPARRRDLRLRRRSQRPGLAAARGRAGQARRAGTAAANDADFAKYFSKSPHAFRFGGEVETAMSTWRWSIPGFLVWLFWLLVAILLIMVVALIIHHFGGFGLSFHIGDFNFNVGVS